MNIERSSRSLETDGHEIVTERMASRVRNVPGPVRSDPPRHPLPEKRARVCRSLRARGLRIPIVALTHRPSGRDRPDEGRRRHLRIEAISPRDLRRFGRRLGPKPRASEQRVSAQALTIPGACSVGSARLPSDFRPRGLRRLVALVVALPSIW